MGLLTLDDLRHECLDDGAERLSATATIDGTAHVLTYVGRGAPLARTVDPFVPLVVLRALRDGHDVRIGLPVSAQLLDALPTVLDIFCGFERRFVRPEIEATPLVRERTAPGGEIAFFSGGVDSFYTVLKHRESLGALLFVHGFDLALGATALRDMVSGTLREAARSLELPFVEVETNARPFVEQRDAPGRTGKWTMVQGAVLAGLALVTAPRFARAYVPSGDAYAALTSWGTHPLLDPLWSTEEVQVVHDGCERTRLQKLERLAESPLALSALRVCFKNPEGAYNCGTCDKCLRTMVELRAVGALDRCATFAQPLSLARVRRLALPPVDRNHIREAARFLAERGADPELRGALETAITRVQRREVTQRVLGAAQRTARSWLGRLGRRTTT